MDNDYSLQELLANMQQMVQTNNNKLHNTASATGGPSWTYTPATNDYVTSIYNPTTYPAKQWDDRYTYTGNTTSINTSSLEELRYGELSNRMARMEKILEERLCVLNPNPEMLQKQKILQEIYNQYKAAEALLFGHDADE
jgi:hypothetical protein